jgi:hypothetical protein
MYSKIQRKQKTLRRVRRPEEDPWFFSFLKTGRTLP